MRDSEITLTLNSLLSFNGEGEIGLKQPPRFVWSHQ